MSQRELRSLLDGKSSQVDPNARTTLRSGSKIVESKRTMSGTELAEQVKALERELDVARKAVAEVKEKLTEAGKENDRLRDESRSFRENLETVRHERDELSERLRAATERTDPAGHLELIKSFEKVMEAQTKMLAAQANAMTVQSFPPLPLFTGEDIKSEYDEFDHWLKRFEERAKLAAWTDEQKFGQLKLHLGGYALRVFDVLEPRSRSIYAQAVDSMKSRFRSLDIPELCGLDFHQMTQKEESIEKLGVELQRLCRKAFPSSSGKDLDRLLKGRFYQALLPKWQKKLGAPKLDESFMDLYDRARTLEKHEEQYAAAARTRDDRTPTRGSKNSDDKATPKFSQSKESQPTLKDVKKPQESTFRKDNRGCFLCGNMNHIARDCYKQKKTEAAGKSGSGNSVTRTATLAIDLLKEVPDEELEQLLAHRRLQREQNLLDNIEDASTVRAVTTNEKADAVGPTLYVNVTIEGVPVKAMVDCGSQSTIISRSLLRKVRDHMLEQGKPTPTLQTPGLRMFGKDGQRGPEIVVTARADLTLEADGLRVTAPVFVQPQSEQDCLLGMNVAPALGLKFLNAKGEPLIEDPPEARIQSAKVRLVQSVKIPGRMGTFVKAEVDGDHRSVEAVTFEPALKSLQDQGLCSPDAVLTYNDGSLLVPVQNFRQSLVELDPGMELGTMQEFELSTNQSSPTPYLCQSDDTKSARTVGQANASP